MKNIEIACSKVIGTEEDASELACAAEADRNGFTRDQADLCDDGMLGCVACPFRAGGAKNDPAHVAVFESIIWYPVARLPDADLIVQLFDGGADEPVWAGYFDGAAWFYDNGTAANPTRWAHMPAGPGAVLATSPIRILSKVDVDLSARKV